MPLHRGQKKKRLRQDRLEHNITQFSYGCRVLCSGGLNHINHRVHHVHLELTTKRLKTFLTKEPQRTAAIAASVEVSQNHFDIWCVKKGDLVFLKKRGFYYSKLSSPRWRRGLTGWGSRWLLFSNSFTFFVLPCGFTSTDEFVLQQLLNCDGMNKLS
jgi:hypothetical protein